MERCHSRRPEHGVSGGYRDCCRSYAPDARAAGGCANRKRSRNDAAIPRAPSSDAERPSAVVQRPPRGRRQSDSLLNKVEKRLCQSHRISTLEFLYSLSRWGQGFGPASRPSGRHGRAKLAWRGLDAFSVIVSQIANLRPIVNRPLSFRGTRQADFQSAAESHSVPHLGTSVFVKVL